MKMRCCPSTPGSPEYILHIAHSTSGTPVSLYIHYGSVMIDFDDVIDRVSRYTCIEAVIERVRRCTWRR